MPKAVAPALPASAGAIPLLAWLSGSGGAVQPSPPALKLTCPASSFLCAAVALSVDHKPNLREERLRIEDAGGVVVWAGTWRVSGVLAVSRAFGDRPLKRYIIPTPHVREEVLSPGDDCVILASDGVWDVISNQVRGRGLVSGASGQCP